MSITGGHTDLRTKEKERKKGINDSQCMYNNEMKWEIKMPFEAKWSIQDIPVCTPYFTQTCKSLHWHITYIQHPLKLTQVPFQTHSHTQMHKHPFKHTPKYTSTQISSPGAGPNFFLKTSCPKYGSSNAPFVSCFKRTAPLDIFRLQE